MLATTPHVIGERWARHSYRSVVAQRIPTIFTQPTSLIRIADASIPIHDSGALGSCIQAGSILWLCHIFCFAREDWYTLCMKQPKIVWESRVLNSGIKIKGPPTKYRFFLTKMKAPPRSMVQSWLPRSQLSPSGGHLSSEAIRAEKNRFSIVNIDV